MKFRFFVAFLGVTSLVLGQQNDAKDSLPSSVNQNELGIQSSFSLDSLSTKLRVTLRDSVVSNVVVDTLKLDSLSIKSDSLKIVKKNLPTKKKKKKRKRRPIRERYIEVDTLQMINNYKIFYEDGQEQTVDTTLSVLKDYKFNFLRRDYFELLPLPNVAQGFNRMGYDFLNQPMGPSLGARVNQYGFFESDDIPYFQVATPLTELFFRTTFEQGELVDAMVSVNTSPKLNLMVSYKGLRSLGEYKDSRANGGQFRASINYNDAEERYQLRAHLVAQTRNNQVNGGLNEFNIFLFETAPYYQAADDQGNPVFDENGDPVEVYYDGFLDRAKLTNNFSGESILSGRRFYLGQKYQLKKNTNDSPLQPFRIGNRFTYETRFYEFSQSSFGSYFGEIDITQGSIFSRMDVKTITNETFVETDLPFVGATKAGIQYKQWDFAHGRTETVTGTHFLGQKENQLALQIQWDKRMGAWEWSGQFHHSLLAKLKTDHYQVNAERSLFRSWKLSVGAQYRSQPQNFNFYQNESNYVDLNWDQLELENTKRTSLHAALGHPGWLQLQGEWHRIENYTHFNSITSPEDWGKMLLAAPVQSQNELNYIKLRLFNQFTLGKFSLTNTVQYQEVNQIESGGTEEVQTEPSLLNVPKWITRNTFAFSTFVFNKALYLQTGFHFQFFTSFYADAIHSVLGEYVTQNNKLIGEYPRIDFFINAKINQTRVFLKAEHFNDSMSGYRYYAAPFYPYRDMSIRFGVVWNLFQ